MAIEDDDPLGMLGGPTAGGAEGIDSAEDDTKDLGNAAASAFIDAVHSKDPAAVLDAFKGLSALSQGDDDMNMSPDSASGGMIPSPKDEE